MNKYASGFIRWRGAIPLGLFLLFATCYLNFFLDAHLESALEHVASQVNHGPVRIKSLSTEMRACRVRLKGVEISHPSEPDLVLVGLDQVTIALKCAPLFRKKLIVEEMRIEGIQYRVQKPPGENTETTETDASPNLFDRVAVGLYEDIRQRLGENPLRSIGILLTGIDLNSRVEEKLKQLQSPAKIKEVTARLSHAQSVWEKEVQALPPSRKLSELHAAVETASREVSSEKPAAAALKQLREELAQETKAVGQIYERMAKEIGSATVDLAQTENLITQDVQAMRNELKLPRFDQGDLTPSLFGPALLTQLERVGYWIDLSRRKMPVGQRLGKITTTTREGSKGTIVSFGKESASPEFLLIKGVLISEPKDEAYGKVNGTITNFSSDPLIHGAPAQLNLNADFSKRGIRDFQWESTIDHTGATPKESIRFHVASFATTHFPVSEGGDAQLHLKKGNAQIAAHLDFEGNSMHGELETKVEGSEFEITSRFKGIQNTIESALKDIPDFRLRLSVKGPFEKLEFIASSSLGQQLASSLHGQFKHQLLAIDDDLRKNLLDRVHPMRSQAIQELLEIKEQIVNHLELRLKTLQEMTRYADEHIERANGKARRRG